MDRFDRRILYELQRDGRISNAELARRVGLTPTPCWRRVQRLEADGVIERYAAVLAADRVGLHVNAFVYVTLDLHRAEAFEAAIIERDEVLDCYAMTGDRDYLVHVMLPGIEAFDRFLREVLVHLPGVGSVRTSLALRAVKRSRSLSLDYLE